MDRHRSPFYPASMAATLFTHSDMLAHRPGDGHPERPERLRAVIEAIDDSDLRLDRREASEVSVADLERCTRPITSHACWPLPPLRG